MPSTIVSAVTIVAAVAPAMVIVAISGCVARGLRTSAIYLLLTVLIFLGYISLNDLVELTSIKPNSPTFRAIIDLDALALAHNEIDPAKRAKQPGASLARSFGSS